MATHGARWRRRLLAAGVALVAVAVTMGAITWYKLFREVPQPDWITADQESMFLHGSIGAEGEAGIPYWLVVVLPRIFGDYLPGPGGYASLGLPWKPGTELPVGFSKKTVGLDRVAFNCALCHATQYRTQEDEEPTIVAAGGSHTADIQGLLDFFSAAANDPRFEADTILAQIDLAYPLSWVDRMLYKYLLIPLTRKRLIEQGQEFAWAKDRPRWGPGRDAPMNLTKFNFLQMPDDDSIDTTDFPSIWNLQVRIQEGRTWPEDDYALVADFSRIGIDPSRLMLMNLAGDTTSFRSVVIDSALGLQAQSSASFRRRMQEIEDWLMTLAPPKYPLELDSKSAALGLSLFEEHCAECHANGRQNRLGTVIPLAEVDSDPERTKSWTLEAANQANETVRDIGVPRTPMSKPAPAGYIALQLDGLWLRAPYLHNGSVPTVRALLEPEECRPTRFYRGYDVLDGKNLGFVSRRCSEPPEVLAGCEPLELQHGCMSDHDGWLHDTRERGNGSRGHRYGIDLSPEDKQLLVEYLKSL